MKRFANLSEIRRLDPATDHCRIVHLTNGYEFPWDSTRSLEMALYRTYCVPSVSKILDASGEFRNHTQKRYDDTALLVAELIKSGYDSERGREAIRRMNRIHAHFAITNEDFLYVLSTFIYEPVRWYERFGWRKPDPNEKLALYYFWREIGRRMNIKNIPASYEDFERFNREYEQQNFRYDPANRAVGIPTRDLFASWYPGFLTPAIRLGIYSLLDEPLLAAFKFPKPPGFLRAMMAASLKARGMGLRFFPVRKRPGFLTEGRPHSYRKGYKMTDLGPAHMLAELNRKSSLRENAQNNESNLVYAEKNNDE